MKIVKSTKTVQLLMHTHRQINTYTLFLFLTFHVTTFSKVLNSLKEGADLTLHSITLCNIKPAITSSKCKNRSFKGCKQRLLAATMLCHQFIMAAILPTCQGLSTNQVSNKEVRNEIGLF